MNLTTKEIAATLNVLPESILKSKYRLKKKMGLAKETDLTSFLNSL
jgi:DNA-binding NarL/FixJ family response regulator